MKFSSIYPYYYPTTVVVVDDNTDFLVNFSLLLNEDIAFKLYSSPLNALQSLNRDDFSSQIASQSLSSFQGNCDASIQDNIISVDVSKIKSVAGDKNRFSENAIAIVDYDMPDMDGLQFCQMLNKNVKKIMISGVADEKIAVDAFNRGIIDKFILKNDEQTISEINNCIYEFQNKYMYEKTQILKNTLNLKAYGFLNDPAFINYFFDLLKRLEVVEYYLLNNPTGFLLFNQEGEAKRLLVMDDDEIASHAEVVADQDGPHALLEMLDKKDVVPYFWQTGGFYTNETEDWQSCIYPSYRLESAQNYYVAIVEDINISEFGNHYPYNSYIEYLDEQFLTGKQQ